ncbi:hypothetical protein B0H34DRAFT_805257 [Crassisporium funariophilum]|nr:hypothetical protein B0H34DRAFT_811752 [Crassisporium funariophilum]KAF8162565.1 hypothetical protein B0H34DRAFT_805270 [Crassisporium funariophilum]KAF8166045.1 hypothetical protein B0H34DRAFT_805257 [Crassisporium funariophilum]
MSTTLPQLAIDDETAIVAKYMKAKFPEVLRHHCSTAHPLPCTVGHPKHWSLSFSMEVDLALDVIARAFHHSVSTDWDAQRYADLIGPKNNGISGDQEATMFKSFKPIRTDHLEITPSTIADRHGKLLVWYLPNILSPERQESMFSDLKHLERMIKVDAGKSANWRSGPDYFHPIGGGLKPGTFNISPAWFEQGHETEEHHLKVSSDLLKDNCISEWLEKCTLPFALIGGILSIIQPELFEAGQRALRQLASAPTISDNPIRMLEILKIWYPTFSALAVISNRATPLHLDTGGRAEWLDLILWVYFQI